MTSHTPLSLSHTPWRSCLSKFVPKGSQLWYAQRFACPIWLTTSVNQNLTMMATIAFNQFVNPWALAAIDWWYYVVYCGWLIFELGFVVFFLVETKGRFFLVWNLFPLTSLTFIQDELWKKLPLYSTEKRNTKTLSLWVEKRQTRQWESAEASFSRVLNQLRKRCKTRKINITSWKSGKWI